MKYVTCPLGTVHSTKSMTATRNDPPHSIEARLCVAVAAFALSLSPVVSAQVRAQQGSISQPVVQALPSRESLQLQSALSRLAVEPRNVPALVDAGNSARAMGDYEAAIGFFRRAEQIEASNPRVKAGLAAALVMSGDPFGAIPLFDSAVAAGADPLSVAADRGLAYDLVGQPDTAQQYYRQALGRDKSVATSRRLAISLAISGREREVEEVLLPLLKDQDKAAWRARAFSLAMLGKTKQAVKITETLLPPTLAKGIVPYLEYMPRLTAAQKAAAANLGQFPRASEIGRDDPRVALFKPRTPTRTTQVAAAGEALTPRGRALGSEQPAAPRSGEDRRRAQAAEKARREAERRASRVKPPEVRPERTPSAPSEPVLASASQEAPTQSPAEILANATPARTARRELPPANAAREPEAPAQRPSEIFDRAAQLASGQNPAPQRPAVAQTASPSASTAMPSPSPAQGAAQSPAPVAQPRSAPGFDLASISNRAAASAPASAAQTTSRTPVSAPAPAAAEPAPQFGALFGDLGAPSVTAAPKAGAVDITKIEAPREEPPPSHPSRIWVQLGIGQNLSALAFDWRKFTRQAPDAFKGLEGHVSQMNQTNRLLAGPFESRSRANTFLKELGEAGFEGPYVWTSPAGQVVDKL